MQYSDNSFNVKPTKMLSDCGGRGLRADPPSPTGVNLLPALKVSEVIMMQENNLLNRNSTNDIQGVKLTYALVILISSIETENQLSYCGSTMTSKCFQKQTEYAFLTGKTEYSNKSLRAAKLPRLSKY